jgi:hypothetical protein
MNKDHNIPDEEENLKGLPGNRNPFKADQDYFKSFSSRLQNKIDGLDEIQEMAPLLSAIPKYSPFEIPAGYFDELPTLIQERVLGSKKGASFEWLISFFKPRFAFPALATILLLVAGITYMNKTTKLPDTELAEELSLEERLYEIDESTLIESLTAENIIENTATRDENSIENYLIDNNIDETTLEL